MWFVVAMGTTSAQAADPAFDAVVRALSARDPVACETVEALTPTPVETLRAVVDTVEMPPWAPMTAAQCLVDRHPAEVAADMSKWVTDPALKGLGLLVLGSLDRMPLDVALPIAKKALAEGSDKAKAAQKLGAATTPELRALVKP